MLSLLMILIKHFHFYQNLKNNSIIHFYLYLMLLKIYDVFYYLHLFKLIYQIIPIKSYYK